jgi:alanyl-tRNA synthetase
MVSKLELIKEFQKKPERYWKVKLFDELGFKRRRCIKCGKYFWSLTDQKICVDSTCRPYEFIGKPPTKRKFDYFEIFKLVRKFFEKRDHVYLEPYPIVCRWFNLYFTIAGIVDFYRLTNGKLDFELPANPTILIQPCLRFNDIENVGVNGKSFTCFGMIQQTSLYNGKEGYWKDECIELDFEFLTKILGIKKEDINFIEDVWIGAGAFGSCLEYHTKGLELGNAVFTEFVGDLKNYSEMKEKIIDMGAGWERFTWISQGTPTCYDCVFGPAWEKILKVCDVSYDKNVFAQYAKFSGRLSIDEVNVAKEMRKIAKTIDVPEKELQKNVSQLQAIYSILDHTRALVFAISDNAIPSNVGGGYNLRVILRRVLDFIDKFKWNLSLQDVALWHIRYLSKLFPKIKESEDQIMEIVEIERKRYEQTKLRSRKIVKKLIKLKREITEDELLKLYESDGISPEMLMKEGLKIKLPQDFYAKLTERRMKEKEKVEEIKFDVKSLPPTKLLFYENPKLFEFGAKVIKSFNNWIVLDQTAFFPTQGGQLYDKGFIDDSEVLEVQKIGNIVLHKVSKPLPEGKIVKCKVDKKRRKILSAHHVATHIINYAARKVLGKQVWQHSAYKDVDKARLDITHYEKLSNEDVKEIEKIANEVVREDLPIEVETLKRGEAEMKYGFRIYQGGPVEEKELRIVKIGEDIEACSGTHNLFDSTKDIGPILILRTKRIQDGVDRIEFCAGEIAINLLKEKEEILNKIAKRLGVKEEEVPKEIEKIFKKWKKLRKKLRRKKT